MCNEVASISPLPKHMPGSGEGPRCVAGDIVWDEPGTYVETEVEFVHTVTHSWNHGLGEVVTALLDEGMTITQLIEHDSLPWDGLKLSRGEPAIPTRLVP